MADLGPLIGVPSGRRRRPGQERARPAARRQVLPTQAFRTDRWRDMDADVALEAASIIHDSKLPLSDLSVHVVLQDGVLTLDP